MDPETARDDAIVLLTGLIRALDKYADADPDTDLGETIRMDTNQIRQIRDGLVDGGTGHMDTYRADYGGAKEWEFSFLRLVNRPDLEGRWQMNPSRDAWERAD